MRQRTTRKEIILITVLVCIALLGIGYSSWTSSDKLSTFITIGQMDYIFDSSSIEIEHQDGTSDEIFADIEIVSGKGLKININNALEFLNKVNLTDKLNIKYSLVSNSHDSVGLKSLNEKLGEFAFSLEHNSVQGYYNGTSLNPTTLQSILPESLGRYDVYHTFEGTTGCFEFVPISLPKIPTTTLNVNELSGELIAAMNLNMTETAEVNSLELPDLSLENEQSDALTVEGSINNEISEAGDKEKVNSDSSVEVISVNSEEEKSESKEERNSESNEDPKDVSREEGNSESNEDPKGVSKEEGYSESSEDPKGMSKEEGYSESSEDPKGVSKEEGNNESSEDPEGVSKEEGNIESSEELRSESKEEVKSESKEEDKIEKSNEVNDNQKDNKSDTKKGDIKKKSKKSKIKVIQKIGSLNISADYSVYINLNYDQFNAH